MIKKIISAMLAAAVLITTCGCAAILEGGTSKITKREETESSEVPEKMADVVITRKNEIKQELISAIENHRTSFVMRFEETYNGNVENDVYEVCMDISNNTPLGAYAVYYMSHSVNRYLTYYEAEITITYKRTAEEIASVVKLHTIDSVKELIYTVMKGNGYSIVFNTTISTVTAEFLNEYITQLYYGDPEVSVYLPEISVSTYPEGGRERIIDIELTYPEIGATLRSKMTDLTELADEIASDINSEDEAAKALETAAVLINMVEYDVVLASQGDSIYDYSNSKFTAYGALAEGVATSEGIAMAYKLLCDYIGIECHVVIGRHSDVPHVWNIVKIGEEYYHMDIATCDVSGGTEGMFQRDSDILSDYGWDTGKYPQCTGTLTFEEVVVNSDLSDIVSPFAE